MIVKKILHTCLCDNCKVDIFEGADFSCSDIDYIGYEMEERDWKTIKKKHYCDDCWSWDDDDKIVINKGRFKNE